jgi:outer membrane lipoprotein carrier protein
MNGWMIGCAALSALAAGCGGRESSADSPADSMAGRRAAAESSAATVLPAPAPTAAVATGDTGRLRTPAQAPVEANDTRPWARADQPRLTTRSQADEALEVLRRVEQAASGIRTLEADFVQNLTVPLLNQSRQSTGRLYQKRPDRFLMRFTQPAGDIMVADGQHFWIYYPSTDRTQVIRTSIGQGGAVDLQRQFVGDAVRRFVPTLNGDETVDGHATRVLTLVPRGQSPYRILKLWVDAESYLVRRFEMEEENGSVRRVEMRGLRINQPIADDLFSFTPPAGTQVFDQ